MKIEAWCIGSIAEDNVFYVDYDERSNEKPQNATAPIRFQHYRIFPTREEAEKSVRYGECYFEITKVFIELRGKAIGIPE